MKEIMFIIFMLIITPFVWKLNKIIGEAYEDMFNDIKRMFK